MSVNPNDYSREERRNSSRWSYRHKSGSRAVDTLRHNRRLTLIDMILLIVMIGVLVPWVVHMDNTTELGPYRVKIDERSRNNLFTLILKVTLPSGSEAVIDETVGWRVNDQTGSLLHEEFDLPPMPGETREFLFSVTDDQPLSLEILAGSEGLEINIPVD